MNGGTCLYALQLGTLFECVEKKPTCKLLPTHISRDAFGEEMPVTNRTCFILAFLRGCSVSWYLLPFFLVVLHPCVALSTTLVPTSTVFSYAESFLSSFRPCPAVPTPSFPLSNRLVWKFCIFLLLLGLVHIAIFSWLCQPSIPRHFQGWFHGQAKEGV